MYWILIILCILLLCARVFFGPFREWRKSRQDEEEDYTIPKYDIIKEKDGNEFCVIITTTASEEEANKIAGLLVENKIAACAQISSIASVYRWHGKVEKENEYRLVIKTTEKLYTAAEKLIKTNHSYEAPQIVKIPITGGSIEYLDWILTATS